MKGVTGGCDWLRDVLEDCEKMCKMCKMCKGVDSKLVVPFMDISVVVTKPY